MAHTKRSRRSYGAGAWGRNRLDPGGEFDSHTLPLLRFCNLL